MNMDGYKRICGMLLAVLLVVSAVPAGAEDIWTTKNEFDLQLDGALNGESFELFSNAPSPGSADTARQAESSGLNLAQRQSVSEIGKQALMQSSGTQGAPKKKGTGRWLKKHWYVPVLAAVALGVGLEVGDGKDDVDDD